MSILPKSHEYVSSIEMYVESVPSNTFEEARKRQDKLLTGPVISDTNLFGLPRNELLDAAAKSAPATVHEGSFHVPLLGQRPSSLKVAFSQDTFVLLSKGGSARQSANSVVIFASYASRT